MSATQLPGGRVGGDQKRGFVAAATDAFKTLSQALEFYTHRAASRLRLSFPDVLGVYVFLPAAR